MWLMSKFLERKKLLEPLLVINPSPAVSGKKRVCSKKPEELQPELELDTTKKKKNLCLPFVKLAGSSYVHSRHQALVDSSRPLFNQVLIWHINWTSTRLEKMVVTCHTSGEIIPEKFTPKYEISCSNCGFLYRRSRSKSFQKNPN